MKNKKSTSVLIVSAIAICVICIGIAYVAINLTKPTPFYENHGDFGAANIPLVEPYKVTKNFGNNINGNEHKWQIDLIVPPDKKELYYYLYIPDVTKIAIEKKVIMAYSPNSIVLTDDDKRIGQKVLYWFVIVPDKNIETGFEAEDEFLDYIQTLGIEKPSWIESDVAYHQLVNTGCLDWIPDCK